MHTKIRLAILSEGFRGWDGEIVDIGGVPRVGDSVCLRMGDNIEGFVVIHVTWSDQDVPLVQLEKIKA